MVTGINKLDVHGLVPACGTGHWEVSLETSTGSVKPR